MHDETVDRTTDGTGRICDLTLAQIRALDAGSKKSPEQSYSSGQFKGERVPTLEEALACFPKTGLLLNIHCKTGDAVVEVAELLRRTGRVRQGIVMCEERRDLETLREKCPWARAGYIGSYEGNWHRPWTAEQADEVIAYAAKAGVEFLQVLPECHCTPEQLRFLHDRGIRTTYFVADDEKTMREIVAEGHDFVFTDFYSCLEPVYRQAIHSARRRTGM